jgi:predicted amidohydrolase/GNAT superfamily N-acetyltransferase
LSEQNTLINLRNLCIEDYEDIRKGMNEAYSAIGGMPWTKEQLQILIDKFPEGQLCVEVNERVVGCALAIIVDYDKYGDSHSYKQITDQFRFGSHNPKGDILYGIEVFIHPEFRGMRLARRLYDARKELCESLNLRAIIAGGRIPGYATYAGELTPRQYIDKVRLKEIYDPILTFQNSNGFFVKKILKNYLTMDSESMGHATLLEWPNIYHQTEEELLNTTPSEVRIGLVQWQMRRVANLEALMEHVEFFVDAISDYQSDFIVFPEYFNAPLMAPFNALPESEAIRKQAEYTEPLRNRLLEMAVSYNINIITGSMPYVEDGHLLNVGYLCRRDGTWEEYRKIHITPSEANSWGMVGGNQVKVFDSDAGKIGVLICYDVEFPELSRILATQDMQILFVPFHTDTQNGYNRVRYCAQARAVENECYVAITGSVGNLPGVHHMDIQYAQSAVFSPCDFSFPTNGVVGQTTPNTEMTLIVDVNLDHLKQLHFSGSVHNLLDRRTDLYTLNWNTEKV